LHDWPDEDAVAILASCRKAIGDGAARLLVADTIMPERPVPGPADEEAVFTLDLHMLVLFGARERSVSEFSKLLQEAGFRRRGARHSARRNDRRKADLNTAVGRSHARERSIPRDKRPRGDRPGIDG